MPSRLFQPRTYVKTLLAPLLAVVAAALIAAGIAPSRANPQPGNAGSPSDEASMRLASLVNTNAPDSVFGPNVRANQDLTGYGQHEPSIAVSRVNTNTIIVASKDYRQGNVKQVWIDGSTDGGATWPVQVPMPGIPPQLDTQSDPVAVARDDGRIYVSALALNAKATQGGVFVTWTDDNGLTWHSPSVTVFAFEVGFDDKDSVSHRQ